MRNRELSDGRVALRPMIAEDAEALHEAARESIAAVHPWLPWCHPDYSLEEAIEFTSAQPRAREDDEEYCFVIIDPVAGLNRIDAMHRFANLGYWVRTSETGQGIATAAVRLLGRFGLEELELNRLEIVVAIGNTASVRVAEKAGAHREGIVRRRLFLHGEAHDAVMFSLVR